MTPSQEADLAMLRERQEILKEMLREELGGATFPYADVGKMEVTAQRNKGEAANATATDATAQRRRQGGAAGRGAASPPAVFEAIDPKFEEYCKKYHAEQRRKERTLSAAKRGLDVAQLLCKPRLPEHQAVKGDVVGAADNLPLFAGDEFDTATFEELLAGIQQLALQGKVRELRAFFLKHNADYRAGENVLQPRARNYGSDEAALQKVLANHSFDIRTIPTAKSRVACDNPVRLALAYATPEPFWRRGALANHQALPYACGEPFHTKFPRFMAYLSALNPEPGVFGSGARAPIVVPDMQLRGGMGKFNPGSVLKTLRSHFASGNVLTKRRLLEAVDRESLWAPTPRATAHVATRAQHDAAMVAAFASFPLHEPDNK